MLEIEVESVSLKLGCKLQDMSTGASVEPLRHLRISVTFATYPHS